VTTLLPVKQALFDLAGATFDDTVRAMYSARIVVDSDADRLMIGNASGTVEPESLGPQRTMQEEYDVACIVSVTRNGDTDQQPIVTARAIEIYEGFEYAVRAAPGQNLGVAGVQWAGVTGNWTMTEHPASETKGKISTSFAFNVHVRAMFRLA
jgi:hypothetical protein